LSIYEKGVYFGVNIKVVWRTAKEDIPPIKSLFKEMLEKIKGVYICSSSGLCWARGISEFAAVMNIALFPRSASILIGDRFTSYGLSGLLCMAGARPISVLLISICLVIFVLLRIIGKRRRR